MKLLNKQKAIADLEKEYARLLVIDRKVKVGKLLKSLQDATPVDTGYARDSWSVTEKSDRSVIVNTAEYIQYLNQGHSPQAEPNFIEREALKVGKPSGIIVEVT
jgi:hypothetical protein